MSLGGAICLVAFPFFVPEVCHFTLLFLLTSHLSWPRSGGPEQGRRLEGDEGWMTSLPRRVQVLPHSGSGLPIPLPRQPCTSRVTLGLTISNLLLTTVILVTISSLHRGMACVHCRLRPQDADGVASLNIHQLARALGNRTLLSCFSDSLGWKMLTLQWVGVYIRWGSHRHRLNLLGQKLRRVGLCWDCDAQGLGGFSDSKQAGSNSQVILVPL